MADDLLLEDGDSLGLEDGSGSLLLEDAGPTPPADPVLDSVDPATIRFTTNGVSFTVSLAVVGSNLDGTNPYLNVPFGWSYANLVVSDAENFTVDMTVPADAIRDDYSFNFGSDDGTSNFLTLHLLTADLPRYWYGPLWPFGPLVIDVPGTGIAITSAYAASDLESSEYAEAVAQGFSLYAPSDNTGPVYFVSKFSDGSFSKDNAGTVISVLRPGEEVHIPEGSYNSNRYLCSQYGVDADNADDLLYVVAYIQ